MSYVVWDAVVVLGPMETMASERARRIATEICFNMCFPSDILVLS
jgi:hypothetical protein